jgi:hypothetical protein
VVAFDHGRLKPGRTIERATAQIQAVSSAVMRESLPEEYRTDDAKKFLANKLMVTPGGTGVSQLRSRYQDPFGFSLPRRVWCS